MDALLVSRRATDAQAAHGGLVDLMRGQGGMLMKMGWIGAGTTKVSRGGTPSNGAWRLAA